MLKLYTAPGACSTACHIALQEAGIPFETKIVSWEDGFVDSKEFLKMNPKGYVPFLEIDASKTLSEGVAIMQYIADQAPEKKLMPTNGFERFKAIEMLNYIATELHKGFSPLFMAEHVVQDEIARKQFVENCTKILTEKFNFVENYLEGKNFALGTQYSIVDGYLFTVLSWSKHVNISLSPWKNIVNHQNRIYERVATQRALKAEGLLK